MRIGINQPYFFPYLGYFSLIKHTDRFILLDMVQFTKQGWIQRNRILMPGGGWRYIRIPLRKYSQKDIIKDVRINNSEDWRSEIFKHLGYYSKRAPYFNETVKVVENALDISTDSVAKLNENILKTVCAYLGFPRDISIFSEMDLQIEKPEAPDEWPLNICKSLGDVDEYLNLEGGVKFYSKDKFRNAGINIGFIKTNLREYPQMESFFEPGLSIIDVMMFNDPENICRMLDDFIIL